MMAARDRLQAERKAQGLPWYGGRLPKREKIEARLERAIEMAEKVIEVLPAEAPLSGALTDGAREGLLLGYETAKLARAALARDGEHVDIKLLRAGNEAGAQLYKAALHAAESEFKARRDDDLAVVLALIAAEQEAKK